MFSWEISSFYSILPLFLLSLTCLFKFISRKTTKNQPPSPPKVPIIGHLHKISGLPHRALYSLAQKHGPIMLLHFGSVPVLVVSSVEGAREIMKSHDLIFSNRPKSTIASKLLYNYKDVAFAPYGDYWRQIRSVCVLQLLSNKRVYSFRGIREEETLLMIENIERLSFLGKVINLSQMFDSITNDIVCRVTLGRKHGGGGGERRGLKEILDEFARLLGVFDVGDYIPWLRWVNYLNGLYGKVDTLAKEFDLFLESVVEEHIKEAGDERNGEDFVDVLLQFQKDYVPSGFPITRDTIKALILDVFAAGTDTVSTALEWTMSETLNNSRVLNKLQNEVREIGRGKPSITEDDLDKMQYLKAVIKEALRLHPPVPLLVPRESTQSVKVRGYDIPAGTRVITNAWAVGRDPKSWDQPDEFRPERFLNTSVDFRGQDFGLIPFGAGRRGCPGIQFAASVVEIVLANLVYKFDFALPDGANLEALDMTEAAGVNVDKKFPLLIVAMPSPRLKQDFSTTKNSGSSSGLTASDYKEVLVKSASTSGFQPVVSTATKTSTIPTVTNNRG